MKHTLIILLWSIAVNSFAQTTIESDYVYEGKTFQFTLPEGFKEVDLLDEDYVQLYLLDTNGFAEFVRKEDIENIPFTKGIVTGYTDRGKLSPITIQRIANNFKTYAEEFGSVYVLTDPVVSDKKGIPFGEVQFKLRDYEVSIETINLSAIEFGDFLFFFASFNLQEKDEPLMKYLFDQMNKTIKTLDTEKENTLKTWEYFENISQNNDVETNIDYRYIGFGKSTSSYWSDAYPYHFMTMHDYGSPDASIQGSVYTLSAGIESGDFTDEELLKFVSDTEEDLEVTGLNEIGTVVGDEFTFKKYKVLGNAATTKSLKQIYTTVLEGELIVFFVKPSTNTTGNFTRYYENFVKSMFISETVIIRDDY